MTLFGCRVGDLGSKVDGMSVIENFNTKKVEMSHDIVLVIASQLFEIHSRKNAKI